MENFISFVFQEGKAEGAEDSPGNLVTEPTDRLPLSQLHLSGSFTIRDESKRMDDFEVTVMNSRFFL